MNQISESPEPARTRSRNWRIFAFVLGLHLVLCCVSLTFVAELITYQRVPPFEKAHVFGAVLGVACYGLIAPLFAISRFSFGYFLGFYLYTMIAGFLWLLAFTGFHYDHALARVSIFLSAVAFLVPAMLISSPIKPAFVLTMRNFDLLLYFITIVAMVTVLVGASYNFRLVSVAKIYDFRQEVVFPQLLRYLLSMMTSALLPFAFAGFIARKKLWLAGVALVLMMLLYPVTLSKLTLFAPFWLLFLALLARNFEARFSVVLSLLLPILFGIVMVLLYKSNAISLATMFQYVGTINVRMIALPSIALDVYNDFFSTHDLTYFCQISVVKPLVHCPYAQPLSVTLSQAYPLGNFNASLFATEGIASVGPLFAPFSALVAGLVIALGNRLSSGLPPMFILLSGGILPQVFLNVPLTTTLLTNGAGVLFLLWYITPRSIFERGADQAPTLILAEKYRKSQRPSYYHSAQATAPEPLSFATCVRHALLWRLMEIPIQTIEAIPSYPNTSPRRRCKAS